MAYVIPTPAQLKAMYTAFAAVPDATVQLYIDQAARSVDTSWTETDYADGIMLLACHNMVTMGGLGTGADAQVAAQGMDSFSTIRSGQLTLQRAATSQSGDNTNYGAWGASRYGRQFYWLARRDKPPMTVAAAPAVVGYVSNWPPVYINGWPWVG